MTPTKKAELRDNAPVAVWLAKSTSRGSRYGAGNRAAPNARGAGCWVRATVFHDRTGFNNLKLRLILGDGRSIPLPALSFLQVGELDLHAEDPRA